MSSTDFTLNVLAALNKQLSKRQLQSDLKGMDNSMYVKVIAKLTTALSKKQLANSLKEINNLYVQVGTKFKSDNSAKKKMMDEIERLQKNLNELQIKVGIDKTASANIIESVVSTAKTAQQYADKTSITLDVEIRKEKAVNDILYIGQKYSKLFSNVSASQKYENLLNSAYSISDKSQLQEVRAQISAFTSELKAHGLAVESTSNKWRKLIDRAKDLFSAATLIKVAFTQVKQAITTTIDLDKVYTDLVKVNNELKRNDYADYLSRINQKAKELATTQKGLIEGATEFSKSGYDLATSDKLAEISTILANVGEMSDSDSAKAIISGVQAYDIVDGYTDVIDKANALIDKYNEIGNTSSITTAEIAQGVQKVGSVFSDANTSVDEFIALLSAGNRQYQDADALALGLRTAALRIRGCTSELEAMGEEVDDVYTSTAKLAEKIEGLTNINGTGGVKILEDDEETFRSIYDIFLDISKVYKDMSDTDASALLELIAGKNRASAISATLNNMSEAEEILQNSINAAGSAQKEYNAYLESTEAHIAKFKATLVETYSTFVNGDMISYTADIGTALLDLVNATDMLKHGILAVLAINVSKGITAVGTAIASTAKQLNLLGSSLQQVKNLPLDDVLREKKLREIGEATQNLTEKNLTLLLSQKQLEDSDKITILSMHNLNKEEAQLKLEKMGLTTATNAQSAANVTEAASTNILKGAMTSLKASIIGVGNSIKAAFLSNPIGFVLTGITTAVSIATTVISKYKESLEKANEATKEAIDTFESLASEVENLENKLADLNEQIGKLDPITDEKDLENLRAETAELETQLAILREKQRIAGADADKAAQESLGMTQASRYKTAEYESAYGGIEVTAAYVTKDEELLNAIEAYEEYKTKVDEANKALAEMAETGGYTQKEWREQEQIVSTYSEKMETARSHANELAVTLNEQKQGLNGNTEASMELLNTVDSTIERYNDWLDVINGTTDALEEQVQVEEELSNKSIPTPTLSISQTIDQLNTQLKPTFDSLKSAYNDIFTSDGYNPNAVDIPMLDSIKSSIEEINKLEDVDIAIDMDAFDTLATTLTDVNTTEEQARQAFNDFATSIFYATDSTKGMTDETKELVEQLLESLGIVNATEVAEYALMEAKAQAVLVTHDLADVTEDEYIAILAEGEAAGLTRQQIYNLTAAEIAFGNNDLNTEQKIGQLRNLAKAYGDTASAALATAIANDLASGHTDTDTAINDLMAQINAGVQKVDIDFSPIEKSAAKAGSSAGKAYTDALKDKLSDLNDIINYIGDTIGDQIDLFEDQKDAAVDALEAEKEAAEEALEAEKALVQEKIDAKQAEIDAIKDAAKARKNEIDLQKAQYDLERMQNQRTMLVNYMPDTIVI